ncbi:hypothetical protein [Haloarcula laminariae]|uniref:hypothetical protein n=1 Tax=Haloarcula laminariae TaxID=2961577 RepID=UPI002406C335|nr:hypothetical protein [Halomicroarcula sp. FL173]
MEDDKYDFYGGYRPDKNVRNRLDEPNNDYKRKAAYRDILGILESKQVWSLEDAIEADEILEEIEYWDDEERTRQSSPPKKDKTVRNKLSELHEKNLVNIRERSGIKNLYWKIPDEEVSHILLYKISIFAYELYVPLEKLFCRQELVLIGTFVYILGTILKALHPVGFSVMITGFLLFCIGHFMASQGILLFQHNRNN